MEVSSQLHIPVTVPSRKQTRYPAYDRFSIAVFVCSKMDFSHLTICSFSKVMLYICKRLWRDCRVF